ncbi:unnamed protein product [Rotaria magnacalcarata]|uniref:Uncharacterized protein n=1 Tax=Rotaria magnacalcarata TaxID=392030 RepID=A0A814YR28_9BILA|nr:unnamed protein product [Rotaria magnacalcarata]CAF4879446.1 unnamed protein product [Rotaria magnacalcarata]
MGTQCSTYNSLVTENFLSTLNRYPGVAFLVCGYPEPSTFPRDGKYFPPLLKTSSYKIIVKPISGLQWINHYDKNLCTKSLLFSSSISSILFSCVGVLFLIGTNSIRNTSAPRIIEQLEDTIDLVRFNYGHLQSKVDISIISVFPCHKTSKLFPSISSLTSNVNNYNILLEDLSIRKDFSIVHLPITVEHLNNDGLHIRFPYVSILWNFLEQYLADLIIKKSTFTRCIPRSRTAIQKRKKNLLADQIHR